MFMLSDPLQCYVSFATEERAASFLAEFTATRRWIAHRSGGCGICAKPA
jgi:hypothetical protein